MMRIAATTAVLLLWAGQAGAQAICGTYADIRDILTERHGESLTFAGTAGDQGVIGIWTDPEHGAWTATATRPDGTTCIVARGRGFALTEPVTGDPV
jgi:hypothetical protein